MKRFYPVILLILSVSSFSRMFADGQTNETLVGLARIDVTPDYPVRLSGFGGRRAESEGVTQPIWAKALATRDARGMLAVLITVDNLGVSESIRLEVAQRLGRANGLRPDHLSIAATHTHTAPMLTGVAPTLFGTPIPPAHQTRIDRYTREFVDRLTHVAQEAARRLHPMRLRWGKGTHDLAVNRRNAAGPVDHELPVLEIADVQGSLRGVLFTYACHCVTLSHNHISGDWAGYAMAEFERRHPDCVAMASIGCGADSNPRSGVAGDQIDIASQQGQALADAVEAVLRKPLVPLSVPPRIRQEAISLPLAPARSLEEWRQRASRTDAVGHHARVNLERLARGETLPTSIPYSVQTWLFGEGLAMIFLPGEVVVDYAKRIKSRWDRDRIWIHAYANDSPGYIPSERVLQEGGYEGGDAMIYYDQPQIFAPGIEARIIDTIARQLPPSFEVPAGTEGTRPLPPDEARAAIQLPPGLYAETVAAEPVVMSPVAVEWDAAGDLWVCEMYDYPTGLHNGWEPGGRIKKLIDLDRDGRYDTSQIFLDNLPFPTGLMAWNDGLIVCAAPDLLWARDVDRDGRADEVRTLFTGFAQNNYQARVNSPSLGLDNWIHAANGLLGGTLLNGDRPDRTWDIRGFDFRFARLNDAWQLETVSGLTQQGRARDDWGRWFGCQNGSALLYYPYDKRYLERNAAISSPGLVHSLPKNDQSGRLYPVSQPLERYNDPAAINHVTSACGLGIYRDSWLGPSYEGNAFTCEPVHNLVHRQILTTKDNGLVASSHRAPAELQSEFLASTDHWFRPVQTRTGPDGALYIVDMYRFLIEHPRWVPPSRLAKLDVRAGSDRGRIYRIRREDQPLREVPDLTSASAATVLRSLQSPNGTERDRAHAFCLTHPTTVPTDRLRQIALESSLPQARAQTLSLLAGQNGLPDDVLERALNDEDDRVRAHAVRLAEPALQRQNEPDLLRQMLAALVNDPSSRVARQLAFSLGESSHPWAGKTLTALAQRWEHDPEIRIAILSSARAHIAELMAWVLEEPSIRSSRQTWFESLAATAASVEDDSLMSRILAMILPSDDTALTESQWSVLATLAGTITKPWPALISQPELRPGLENLLRQARLLLASSTAPAPLRLTAVRVIGGGELERDQIMELGQAALRETDPAVRNALLEILRAQSSFDAVTPLLNGWPQAAPGLRQELLQLWMTRPEWTLTMLQAIQAGRLLPQEIGLTERWALLRSSNPAVQAKAQALWPALSNSDRVELVRRYEQSMRLPGDPDRGRALFESYCASCHALDGTGHDVGPDLAALRHREPGFWIQNILDPNAVVEPRYLTYDLATQDGQSLSGILAEETVTHLVLKQSQGLTHALPRSQITAMHAASQSLMPEGLEAGLAPEAMADLLTFLTRPSPPKVFDGNEPRLVTPPAESPVILAATSAAIRGRNIMFEQPFKNIGYWQDAADRVSWDFEIASEGLYEIYVDYACADSSAGQTFALRMAGQEIRGQVGGTGADWGHYVQVRVGQCRLSRGRHQLNIQAVEPLRSALMDLRTVALVPAGQSPVWPQGDQ